MRIFPYLIALCALGCSKYGAIHKSPEQFMKLCEGATMPATNDVDAASLKPHLIAPGMQIVINVAEDASLKRAYIVPPGCTLDFAAVGRIAVCGLTPDELAAKIREPLERDYFQKATVTVD